MAVLARSTHKMLAKDIAAGRDKIPYMSETPQSI
jgi:hypothetical protein